MSKKKSHEERIEAIKVDLVKKFNLHKDGASPKFWDETSKSFSMYVNCGCHERLMDQNCEVGECKPYLPAFENLVEGHDAWIEANDAESVTIRLND